MLPFTLIGCLVARLPVRLSKQKRLTCFKQEAVPNSE